MKPNLCLWRRVFLTGLLGSLPSLGMAGPVIVNFNSPIYTASNWQCFTGWVDGAPAMTFSDQNFLSPTAHYNTALPSSKFYGGASATGTGGLGPCKIADGGKSSEPDYFSASAHDPTGKVRLLVLWKQEDFLALKTGEVTLNAKTPISFNFWGGSGIVVSARLVVQLGSQYLISSELGISSGTRRFPVAISDPSSLQWYSYDPASSLDKIGSAELKPKLSGVTAVGIYAEGSSDGVKTPFVKFGNIIIQAATAKDG